MAVALFLSFLVACGASMRPIPDDVEPVPRTSSRTTLADAGPLADTDAAIRVTELSHTAKPAPCSDSRGRPLVLRRVSADRWLLALGVIDVIRGERKAVLTQQLDTAGRIVGLAIQDIGNNSCLGALGFQNGDVLKSINSNAIDVDGLTSPTIYQSIVKNGAAVVRFERGGHETTVVYEVLGG